MSTNRIAGRWAYFPFGNSSKIICLWSGSSICGDGPSLSILFAPNWSIVGLDGYYCINNRILELNKPIHQLFQFLFDLIRYLIIFFMPMPCKINQSSYNFYDIQAFTLKLGRITSSLIVIVADLGQNCRFNSSHVICTVFSPKDFIDSPKASPDCWIEMVLYCIISSSIIWFFTCPPPA